MPDIDNRIVKMQFDNGQFESGVKESLSTLDKLKNALDFKKSSKGLQGLSDAGKELSNSLNLDGVLKGLEQINNRFSIVGMVVQNLKSQAADALTSITTELAKTTAAVTPLGNALSEITTGFNYLATSIQSMTPAANMMAGWDKYAEKTQSVQTIMNATGLSIDAVSDQLDKLMWYTDETSYNFNDMASNIGKFTSQGIDLETASTAMMGIANWAGLSGAKVAEASRAMYNISQAMGMGYMSQMDWKSIENANMATQEFKQTVIDAAVAEGTLQEVADGLYVDMKGNEVSVNNFRENLKDGWFDKDVMLRSLQDYGDYVNEVYQVAEEFGVSCAEAMDIVNDLNGVTGTLGERAFRAAQEAKTFGDTVEAIKDAVSSGWMSIFENIFGNYNEAKVIWTWWANELWDVFAGPLDELNQKLSGWHRGITDIYEALDALGISYEGLEWWAEQAFDGDVLATFRYLLSDIDAMVKYTGVDAETALEIQNEYLATTADGLTGYEAGIQAVWYAWRSVGEILEIVGDAWHEAFPESTVQSMVSFTESLRDSMESLYKAFKTGDFELGIGTIEERAEALGYTFDQIKWASKNWFKGDINTAIEYAEKLDYMGISMTDLNNAAQKYFHGDIQKAMLAGMTNMAVTGNAMASSMSEIQENFDKLSAAENRTDRLHTAVHGLADALGIVKDFLGAIKTTILEPVFGSIPNLLDKLLEKAAEAGQWLSNLRQQLQASGFFEKKLQKIVTWATGLGKQLKTIWERIKNLKSVKTLMQNFKDLKELVKGLGKDAFKGISDFLDDISSGEHSEAINNIVGAVDALATGLNWLIDTVRTGYGDVKAFFKSLDFSSVEGFFISLLDTLTGAGPQITELFTQIKQFFGGLLGNGQELFTTGETVVSNFWGGLVSGFNDGTLISKLSTAAGYLFILDFMIKLLQGMDAVTTILTGLSNIPDKLSEVLEKTLGVLSSYQTELRTESIKNIAVAMLALAGAIVVMSFVPAEKLYTVLTALTLLMVTLTALVNALTKLKQANLVNATDIFTVLNNFVMKLAPMLGSAAVIAAAGVLFKSIGKGLLQIAIGIGIITYAISKNPAAVQQAVSILTNFLTTIIAILASVTLIGMALSIAKRDVLSVAKLMASFGKAFSSIGVGLLLVAAALAIVASIDPNRIWESVGVLAGFGIGMTVIVGVLAAVAATWSVNNAAAAAAVLDSAGPLFMRIAASILIIAAAVALLSKFGGDQFWDAATVLLLFAVVMEALVGVLIYIIRDVKDASKIETALTAAGKLFTRIATSLLLIAAAIALLSNLGGDNMLVAAGVLGAFLVGMGIFMAVLTHIAATANNRRNMEKILEEASSGFVKMAVSLLIIAGAIALLSHLGGDKIMESAGAIAILAGAIGVILLVLGFLKPENVGAAAMAFVAAAAALILIAGALAIVSMSGANLNSVIPILIALAGALIGLMVVSALAAIFPKFGEALQIVANVLIAIGGTIFLVGAGFLLLAVGLKLLTANSSSIPGVFQAIGEGIAAFGNAIKGHGLALVGFIALMAALGFAIGYAATGIAQAISALAQFMGPIIEKIGTFIEKLVEAVGNGLGKLLTLIAGHLPKLKTVLVAGAALLLTGFLEFLTGSMGDLVNSIVKLLIMGINSIAIAITNNSDEIFAAIQNLLAALGNLVIEGLLSLLPPGLKGTVQKWIENNITGSGSIGDVLVDKMKDDNARLGAEVNESMSGIKETAESGLEELKDTVLGSSKDTTTEVANRTVEGIRKAKDEVIGEVETSGNEIDDIRKERFERQKLNTQNDIDELGEAIERHADGSIIKPSERKAKEAQDAMERLTDAGTGSVSSKIKELGLNYKDMQSWANAYFDGNIQKATEYADALDRLNSSTEGLKWWADNYFGGEISAAMEQGLANLQATGKVTADSWEEAKNNLQEYRGEGVDISDSVAYAKAGEADGEAYGNTLVDTIKGFMSGEGISGSTLLGDMDMGQLGEMLSGAGLSFDAESLDLSNIYDVLSENGFEVPLDGVDVSNLSMDEFMAFVGEAGTEAGEEAGDEAISAATDRVSNSAADLAAATDAAVSDATAENFETVAITADEAAAAAQDATVASQEATAAAQETITTLQEQEAAAGTALTAAEAAMAAMDSATSQAEASGSMLVNSYLAGIEANRSTLVMSVSLMAVEAVTALADQRHRFESTGTNMAIAIGQGLRAGKDAITRAISDISSLQDFTALAEGVSETLAGLAEPAYDSGIALISQFALGIQAAGYHVTGAVNTVARSAATTLRNYRSVFHDAGVYVGQGFAEGVRKAIDDINAAATEAGNAASTALSNAIQSHSPSRVAMRIGGYFGEGFVIGIQRMSGAVSDTAADAGTLAVDAMQSTLERIRDIANGTLEVDPTVRPVLDMSNVTAGARAMNGMFENQTMSLTGANLNAVRSLSGVSAGIRGVSSSPVQSNSDVVSAIQEMRSDINQLGAQLSQMQVVMDSGQLVGSIGIKMDRKLGELQKHRGRNI